MFFFQSQFDVCLSSLSTLELAVSSFVLSSPLFIFVFLCFLCFLFFLQLTGSAERAVLKTEMSISTAEFDTYRQADNVGRQTFLVKADQMIVSGEHNQSAFCSMLVSVVCFFSLGIRSGTPMTTVSK